jgi:hypothetical protein
MQPDQTFNQVFVSQERVHQTAFSSRYESLDWLDN